MSIGAESGLISINGSKSYDQNNLKYPPNSQLANYQNSNMAQSKKNAKNKHQFLKKNSIH